MGTHEPIRRLGIIADLHILSRYALVPPRFRHVDPLPSVAFHGYLWDCWLDFCHRCPPLDALIINGDIIEGENPSPRDAKDALTDDLLMQQDAAIETLELLRKKAKAIWVIRGTPYHEGKHFEAIESIAREIGAEPWAKRRYSGLVLEGDFFGLNINATHHMTLGAIYRGTIADRTALFASAAEAQEKTHPADVIIRSHSHMKYIGKTHGKWVCLTPGWKLVNPYAIKKMEFYRASLLSDIGAIILETQGQGDIAWREYDYQSARFDPRHLAAGADVSHRRCTRRMAPDDCRDRHPSTPGR